MKHNWEYKRLGDVCKANFGIRIVAKDTLPGPFPVYGGGGATFTTQRYNRENCMIVSRFAMSSNCVRFVKGRFFLNDSGLTVESKEDFILQSYIDKFLWCNQPLIFNLGRGVAQKNLNVKALLETSIPVPPMEVQERIVAELDKINEVIEDCRELLRKLDDLAKSLFYDYFGDPVTNPKGWEMMFLKDILNKIGSGATPKGGKESYLGGNISLIRSLNVYNTYFKYEELAKINDKQAYELRNVEVKNDDVLLNITGASVARCFIAPTDTLPARVNQHVAILRPKSQFLQSIYLHRLIIATSFQNELITISRGKNATREALPKAIIEKIAIPVPPLVLQEEFAEKIERIEAQKKAVEQTIAELQTLLDSRMDYWFN